MKHDVFHHSNARPPKFPSKNQFFSVGQLISVDVWKKPRTCSRGANPKSSSSWPANACSKDAAALLKAKCCKPGIVGPNNSSFTNIRVWPNMGYTMLYSVYPQLIPNCPWHAKQIIIIVFFGTSCQTNSYSTRSDPWCPYMMLEGLSVVVKVQRLKQSIQINKNPTRLDMCTTWV